MNAQADFDNFDNKEHIEILYQDKWIEYEKTKSIKIRNELVEIYSYLVKCIVSKIIRHYIYFNYIDDIVSEGLIALLKSVEKFDLSKNVKFETYASIKIKGTVIDYIRKQDCFSRRVKKIAHDINDAENNLSQKHGRNATNEELAEYLNVTDEKLQKMQGEAYSLSMLSFEQIIYENDIENVKFSPINGSDIEMPEQIIDKKEFYEVLERSIELLDNKEKIVISFYYKEQLKIKEIASILEVSDSRVSQIHSNALKKLKVNLDNYLK